MMFLCKVIARLKHGHILKYMLQYLYGDMVNPPEKTSATQKRIYYSSEEALERVLFSVIYNKLWISYNLNVQNFGHNQKLYTKKRGKQ